MFIMSQEEHRGALIIDNDIAKFNKSDYFYERMPRFTDMFTAKGFQFFSTTYTFVNLTTDFSHLKTLDYGLYTRKQDFNFTDE